jgi:hypothetical protein
MALLDNHAGGYPGTSHRGELRPAKGSWDMKERSKEILFAHYLAFGELGATPEARADFAAHPVTRDEALASAAADLAEQITQAIRNAFCLIVARGHGKAQTETTSRRVGSSICSAKRKKPSLRSQLRQKRRRRRQQGSAKLPNDFGKTGAR